VDASTTTGYSESPNAMTASEYRWDWKTRRCLRAPSVLVVLVLSGLAASMASVWGQQPEGYQTYPLRHAQAEQVESALAPLVPAGTEIVADRKGNRVLIRGSAAAQEIAQRVVASLDKAQSAGTPPQTPMGAQSVLRVYTCTPGKASVVAGALHDEFGRGPGVRIVADQRPLRCSCSPRRKSRAW